MINWNQFNEASAYYPPELILEIIDLFEKGEEGKDNGFEARLNQIGDAVSRLDFNAVNIHSHSLKGIIANFYDPVSAQLAHTLMYLSDEKTEEGMAETYAKLKPAVFALFTELDQYRTELRRKLNL
jgi:hypothetical protein